MCYSHGYVKNSFFKKNAVIIFFIAWLLIALFNPMAISTVLIAFLMFTLLIFTLACRFDYKVDTWILLLLLLFFINFIVNKSFAHEEAVRWLIAFWCCLLSIYLLVKACGKRMILLIYEKVAIVISVFCILQQISFLFGISFLSDLAWLGIESRVTFSGPFLRVTAFFAEPAHLGFFLMYPTFIAVIQKKKVAQWLVIFAFFMTFSVGNYLMLVLLLLGFYIFIEKKITLKDFFIMFILGLVFILLVKYIPELNNKFKSAFAIGDELLLSQNRSKAAPYFLIFVNINSLLDNPYFGNGFGTRVDIYHMYLVNIIGDVKEPELFFSDEVFFAKIMGEMGAVGLGGLLYILYRGWSRASKNSRVFLFLFLIVSLKSGSYFNPALFFFLTMYFAGDKYNLRS